MNFDGHRIYNGCPDSTMQKRLDNEAREAKIVVQKCKNILQNDKSHYIKLYRGPCTYYDAQDKCITETFRVNATFFPMESEWVGFINSIPITSMCSSKLSALYEVLHHLNSQKQEVEDVQ